MAMTGHDYLLQLQALLPRGLAWAITQTSTLSMLLRAWADEFARVDLRCDQLLDEADPRTTLELLPDWERVAWLPDPCVMIDQSVDQRRAALLSKLTATGGQSRAYFIALAESMGYAGATIDEYLPANCNGNCNDALYSEDDKYAWTLNLPLSTGGVFVANCNGNCNDALQSWGDEALECRINKYKPAHTSVIFAYQ
jgi:uncharacterized protein YmfQ (DUF2313 family)